MESSIYLRHLKVCTFVIYYIFTSDNVTHIVMLFCIRQALLIQFKCLRLLTVNRHNCKCLMFSGQSLHPALRAPWQFRQDCACAELSLRLPSLRRALNLSGRSDNKNTYFCALFVCLLENDDRYGRQIVLLNILPYLKCFVSELHGLTRIIEGPTWSIVSVKDVNVKCSYCQSFLEVV